MGDDEGFQARGGETEGLRRLRTQLSRKEWVGQFEKPNTNPTTLFTACRKVNRSQRVRSRSPRREERGELTSGRANADIFMTPSTTALSPYMKFGCVSPRVFYHELVAVLEALDGKHTNLRRADGSTHVERIYYLVGAGTPNFDKMEGNPICRQIPGTRIVNSSPRGKTRRRVSLGSTPR